MSDDGPALTTPTGSAPPPASSLSARWRRFFSVILDPWLLVLVLATALSVFEAGKAASDARTLVAALFTTLAALSAGVLGAVVTKRWEGATVERALVARGKAAVRGLKLLLAGVVDLESRACVHLSRQPKPKSNSHPEPVTMALEEIIGRCHALAEEVVSAIENWTDIVPEADIKTQIGVISKLIETRDQLSDELRSLNDKLKAGADKTELELRVVREEVGRTEKELRETVRKLAQTQFAATGAALLPHAELGSYSAGAVAYPENTCRNCGARFRESALSRVLSVSTGVASMDICPTCRSLGPVFRP